jgi:hypothetical protein
MNPVNQHFLTITKKWSVLDKASDAPEGILGKFMGQQDEH